MLPRFSLNSEDFQIHKFWRFVLINIPRNTKGNYVTGSFVLFQHLLRMTRLNQAHRQFYNDEVDSEGCTVGEISKNFEENSYFIRNDVFNMKTDFVTLRQYIDIT